MPELWETADLLDVSYADEAAPPDGFWRAMFPRQFNSTAQAIVFDDLPVRDRRLAPFVAPNVQGRVMKSRGRTMSSFSPAYVKPKHVVDPTKAIARRRGEPLGGQNAGTLSLEQRFDACVADNVRTERELIERREDWMAAQAVIYGEVVVSGEDYPTQTVDFKRDASLTVTLGGGMTWDDPDSTPLLDVRDVRKDAFTLGRAPTNKLIFGTDAWNAWAEHADVQNTLDNMKRGSESNYNATGMVDGSPVEYMGQISGPQGAGRIDLWVYSNDYEDDDGSIVPFLDPRDVVGVGGNLGGFMCYGAILDADAGLQALPRFPKMWKNPDPSVVYTMTQSAPLPVPTNPNNSWRIRALA